VLSGGIRVSAVVFTHIGQLIIDAEVLRGYSDAERGFSLPASSADEQSTQSRLQRIPLKLPGLLWKSLLQLKCFFVFLRGPQIFFVNALEKVFASEKRKN